MAKKVPTKVSAPAPTDSYIAPSITAAPAPTIPGLPADLPQEAREKLEALRVKIESFKEKVMEKFSEYVVGIGLLPPSKDEQQKEKINLIVLMDDTDSTKMSKEELHDKLHGILVATAQEIDKNLNIETLLLTELWQSCYDAKYDWLETIATAAPIFDKGMLAAIKIAEVHKKMVLQRFEKYIVSYVLAGSLVQGKATPKSDIDVFIVIDDTDVKKMTRGELKDKLRAIIIGMGMEAGKATGIENKINIQVYILTDFWDYIKEASPVIFTFLRDGVPFYDRGVFMPWKQLLQMGRVKPSPEAIDMFMHSGDQIMERIDFKLKDIAMEDLFYATLTPAQAALMMYGLPPPTPKETAGVLREVFVKKEKLFEEEYVKILERVVQTRKDIEHGDRKKISGQEVDALIKDTEKYLKRLGELFKQIDERKEQENVLHTYETIVTVIRDVLKLEGIEKVSDKDMIDLFEKEVVQKGSIPEKYLRILKEVKKAKADYDTGKLTKTDIQEVNKNSHELIKFLVEHIQRKRGRELEQTKIRVKYGKTFGEVILLKDSAFIIQDVDAPEKEISKARINSEGGLTDIDKSNLEEYEKAIAGEQFPERVFIKERVFQDLKMIFGKDVEILMR